MKEITRTLVFVGVAAVSVAGASLTHWAMQPPQEQAEFAKLGTEFYPEFDSPNEAQFLRVVTFDEETASVSEFKVEKQEGIWRIPTHYNYPCDAGLVLSDDSGGSSSSVAENQLAKTAASIIGIQRAALAGRRESDHERFGVVDPLTDDAGALEGRGDRITLRNQDGVLADYIIGKEVEGRSGHHYIRHPDEKETYVVQLDVDLSTEFSDWIEDDLLKLQRNNLTEVTINRYSIKQNRITDREVNELSRESGSADWKLAGFEDETRQVDQSKVSGLVSDLDQLKIVGVRPKPKGLNPDLTLDPQVAQDGGAVRALRNSLASKGFLVAEDEQGNRQLVSTRGGVEAATNEGVVYKLHFGEIFTGSQSEIEVGFASEDEASADEKDETSEKSKKAGSNGKGDTQAAEQKGDQKKSDSQKSDDGDEPSKSRYVFVSAHFDRAYLGEKPQKPEKPESQEQGDSADSESSNSSEQSADSTNGNEAAQQGTDGNDGKAQDGKNQDAEQDGEKQDGENAEDPQAAYQKALDAYKQELKSYKDKVKQGQRKAEQLNQRFAGWYYVVSAEKIENLRLKRDDLLKKKEEDGEKKNGKSPLPNSIKQLPKSDGAASPKKSPSPTDKTSDEQEKTSPNKDDSSNEGSVKEKTSEEEKSDKTSSQKEQNSPDSKKADQS